MSKPGIVGLLAVSTGSVQYDLFCQFISNNPRDVSNTIEAWEAIPKYFLNSQQVRKLRDGYGRADPFPWPFQNDGRSYRVVIQPAPIEQPDGSFLACFPGITEELVEEALKKILADQHHGYHDPKSPETWVQFSLQMIRRELKSRGRDRNIAEIKHAIAVLSKCNIQLTDTDAEREIWSSPILSQLMTVGRKKYLADSDSLHVAQLPVFYSRSINTLEYRQFNFDRLMSCNEQLTRWIYKRLIHRFTQASFDNDYHFLFSTIHNSGLLQSSRTRDDRRKVLSALSELKDRGVLMDYVAEERKSGRSVVDVKYTVRPARQFISEQKAANKRASESRLLPVDN